MPLLAAAAAPTSTTAAPLFLIPNGTFIVELVIFVIVLGVIAKFILPPITGAIRERDARIRGGLEAGEEGRAEADAIDRERRAVLDRARAEAREILAVAQRDAEAKRDAARERGQAEFDRLFAEAQGPLEEDRRRAVEEISSTLDALVVEAAQKIVGAPVDPAKHRAALENARNGLAASGEVGA